MVVHNGQEDIPQPPEHFFGLLGNIPDIDRRRISVSLGKHVTKYGPIFKLNVLSKYLIILASQELVNEVCDEQRFKKTMSALKEVSRAIGDGMITAETSNPNWILAHKLLGPSFGPMAIRKMFPKMLDITSQMILKWENFGSDHAFDVSDNFTRLSLDVVALCAFDYRLNNFYTEKVHPFIEALISVLWEASRRATRSTFENWIRIWSWRDFQAQTARMHSICDAIIAERRQKPKDVDDLLNVMLFSCDEETGIRLSDENIRYQVETFLAAGHETTSGLLSFTCWLLLDNPDKLAKATAEVDEVLGNNDISVDHLSKLKYIDAVLKESLRLQPPAAQMGIGPNGTGGLLAGKYPYSAGDIFILDIIDLHRDPKVWGADATAFRPERMLNGRFEQLPPNAWKPFGNGVRACIGRDFAMQEAIMTIALILQRFHIEKADPLYSLRVEQTITQKPVGFFMKARRRPGTRLSTGIGITNQVKHALLSPRAFRLSLPPQPRYGGHRKSANDKAQPLLILYGSNSGTCKSFAEDVATRAAKHGFLAGEDDVRILDSAVEKLPIDRPVIIICSSYDGRPTEDSKNFVAWLERRAKDRDLRGVTYAILGAGNTDWAETYQRTPKFIDKQLEILGASRLTPLGKINMRGDIFGAFDEWLERIWSCLPGSCVIHGNDLRVEIHASNRHDVEKDMVLGTVIENRQIACNELGYSKRHMEISLPKYVRYRTGDHVVVLPTNSAITIRRVLSRFSLPDDASITIMNSRKSYLPNKTHHLWAILAHSLELNTPISKTQLRSLATFTSCTHEIAHLISLIKSNTDNLSTRYSSILDVLEKHPTCAPPLSSFLDMLQPLRPRRYSISSSLPPSAPPIVSLTYDVVAGSSTSNPSTSYIGPASNYLASLHPGQKLHCAIRSTNFNFHLPANFSTPIILVAAGTGIAPIRGFLQERAAALLSPATSLGKAIFYFGCRDPDQDYLYADELAVFEQQGVVEMRPCFSRKPEDSKGFRYVHDRIWAERKELTEVFRMGAKVFVCGSREKLVAKAEETVRRIYGELEGVGEKQAREWFERMRGERFVADVYD